MNEKENKNPESDKESVLMELRKFSHALRDFRNYIHPREQARSGFNPDIHTADICFRVLKLAIIRLTGGSS